MHWRPRLEGGIDMHVTGSQPDTRLSVAEARASLKAWEGLAQSARGHFHEGRIECAVALLVRALDIARRAMDSLLPQQAHPDDCMAAWVVTHHNLADLLMLRGQRALAADHLCDAHAGLLAWADGSQGGAVQLAAWRHLRETRGALLAWRNEQGPHPGVDAALQAAAPAGHAGRADLH